MPETVTLSRTGRTVSFPKVQYSALTDVGVKRSHNQDAVAAQPAADEAHWLSRGHVFIVADGMGGHAVGEKASAKAVQDIPLTYTKHVGQDGTRAAIKRAFTEANAGIFEIGQRNPEFQGMGTTGTALVLRPDGAWIGHVGDSRAYRIRKGVVEQLTFDHSWVWEIARRQGIDPDELGDFKKNVIIRSLGPDAEVEVDIEGPHPLAPGDIFLMCSDGLSNQVPGDELGAIATTLPPDQACKFLIELANLRGGPDNITCVIVRMPGDAGDAPAPRGPGGPSKFKQMMQKWDKAVPWSYTFLGTGLLVAILALVALYFDMKAGGAVLLAAAAVLILPGMYGLIQHIRATPKVVTDSMADFGERELHVHKRYEYEVGKPIHDRLADLETGLLDDIKQNTLSYDENAYIKLASEASHRLNNREYVAAFRARCLAVQILAGVVNKHRSRGGEDFRPNWGKN